MLYGADPAFLDHDTGPGHPERPGRLEAARRGLEATDLVDDVEWLEAREVTRVELERVHDAGYLDRLEPFLEAGGGRLDPDTVTSAGSLRAARLAAGLGIVAVDRLVAEPGSGPAFLAVRPPGHHAVADRAMGFCLFNNVAVTAAELIARGERVAVIDWDAHHGNGTQDIFYTDPAVFYVSTHQHPFYPGTGTLEERGAGDGLGTTLNLPMPAGTTGDAYLAAFDEVIGPAVEAFGADWILVSAGYDAHRDDPLTALGLTAGDFGDFALRVAEMALSTDRVVAFLEGGYDLDAVSAAVAATLVTWAGGTPDHPEPPSSGGPGREVVHAARAALADTA